MIVSKVYGPAASKVLETYGAPLALLRMIVPDLLLTGGAVRDVYFDRPVKDLDFMTCSDSAHVSIAEFYGETFRNCLDEPVNEYEGDSNTLLAAYETSSKSVNVLHVSNALSHIAQFPDSISQIWTDGVHVYASDAFKNTEDTRKVYYSERMTDERLSRISSKYQDFQFAGCFAL